MVKARKEGQPEEDIDIRLKFEEAWRSESEIGKLPLTEKAKTMVNMGGTVPRAISGVMLAWAQESVQPQVQGKNLAEWISGKLKNAFYSPKEALDALFLFGFIIPPTTVEWASEIQDPERTDREVMESLKLAGAFFNSSGERDLEYYLFTENLLNKAASKFKEDPSGILAGWSAIEAIMDIGIQGTNKSKSQQKFQVKDLVFPLERRVQKVLVYNQNLAGAVFAINLYGRIYANGFASQEEIREGEELRRKFKK